ncbi:MAG: polysaccharide deacetylase family protein [Gammaproteobacteria bacterium]|nr:polysaccharide deacetylase family protein [Gammaproteobacteria bacterium]
MSAHRRKFVILAYHRVVPEPDALGFSQIDARTFDSQMRVLRRFFTVLPLAEAVTRMRGGELPPRSVVLTFDDGYADNLHVALPILKKYGFPATVFVATGYMNGGRMWNDTIIEAFRRTRAGHVDLDFLSLERLRLENSADRRVAIMRVIRELKYRSVVERLQKAGEVAAALGAAALPTDLMLTDDKLRALQASGVEIGGHTVTHPILSELSAAEAAEEISGGRKALQQLLDAPVRSFAYPNGKPAVDYRPKDVAAVRDAGFEIAVSTAWGAVRSSDDALQLPRIGFSESRKLSLGFKLLRSFTDPVAQRV